jgi:vacuolar iron transporter family protein
VAARLNWLRAGVLGANDGVVSTAALVIGVAAATPDTDAIATAGVAGLVAGAVSMALGEYVSVSTQRDSEEALIAAETEELRRTPEEEFRSLVVSLVDGGLSHETAHKVAEELTARDPLPVHLQVHVGITPTDRVNPWAAALSSFVSFTLGSLLPLIAILLPPQSLRIPVAFIAVLSGLTLTGAVSAYLGHSAMARAIIRLVIGGGLAMATTYAVGEVLGTTVA